MFAFCKSLPFVLRASLLTGRVSGKELAVRDRARGVSDIPECDRPSLAEQKPGPAGDTETFFLEKTLHDKE